MYAQKKKTVNAHQISLIQEIKQASRRCLQSLRVFHPKQCSDLLLAKLVAIFFSVDVRLFHKLIEWFQGKYDAEFARKLMWKLIKSADIPLKFQVTAENGLCLAMFEEFDATKTSIDEAKLVTVPSIFEDGSFRKQIPVSVRLNDMVLMRGANEYWCIVHELNADTSTIILRRAQSHELDGNSTTSSKSYETREVAPIFLLGAAIRRRCRRGWIASHNRLSSNTRISTSNVTSNSNNDTSVGGDGEDDYYFSIPGPKIANSVKEIERTINEYQREQQFAGIQDDEDEDERKAKPKSTEQSDWSRGVPGRIEHQHHRRRNAGGNMRAFSSDPIREMQNKSVLRVWLKRKQELTMIKKLFVGESDKKIDPSCADCRDWWLMICRALKTLCRGDSELLPVFEAWTRQCTGEEGRSRASVCRKAWAAARPDTNCDDDTLARARIYLKENKIKADDVTYDPTSGKYLLEYSRLSPQICSVLDSVETMIHFDAQLVFIHRQQCIDLSIEPSHSPPSTITTQMVSVPAVNYEIDIPFGDDCFASGTDDTLGRSVWKWFADRDHDDIDAMGGLHRSIGQFVSSDEIPATIRVGDVLMVRLSSFLAIQSKQAMRPSQIPSDTIDADLEGSFQVLRVDLLFARLFVQECDPAPQCWRSKLRVAVHNTSSTSNAEPIVECNACNAPFWAPIASLWGATICRPLSTSQPFQHLRRSDAGTASGPLKLQYTIFLTPMPDMDEMIQFLESLPKLDVKCAKAAMANRMKSTTSPKQNLLAQAVLKATKSLSSKAVMPQVSLALLNIESSSVDLAWTVDVTQGNEHGEEFGHVNLKTLNEAAQVQAKSASTNNDKLQSGLRASRSNRNIPGVKFSATTKEKSPQICKHGVVNGESVDSDSFQICIEVRVDRNDIEYGRVQGLLASGSASRLTSQKLPYQWLEVYRGDGQACRVSGLQPAVRYTLRARLLLKKVGLQTHVSGDSRKKIIVDIAHGYAYATTLAEPLKDAPILVGPWERGSRPGHCHAQISVAAAGNIQSLPLGSSYSVEGCISSSPPVPESSNEVESLHMLPAEQNWTLMAQGTAPTLWVGGNVSGRRLLLRTRIVNSEGLPSAPSNVFAVFDVPDFDAV